MDDSAQETTGPGQDQGQGQCPAGQAGQARKKASRFKAIYATVLYLALLASGLFLADQVHVWWTLRQQARLPVIAHPQAGTGGWRASQPTSQESLGPRGILALGDQQAGLIRLDGDPGDLPPPPGAVRRWAFQRTSGGLEQYARYNFSGSVAEAGDFYLKMLAGRGYHLVSDQSQDAAKRLLVFASPLAKVVEINLYKGLPLADSVYIGLRVRQVGQASAGLGTAPGAGAGVGSGPGK
jgi:hypothetical protein